MRKRLFILVIAISFTFPLAEVAPLFAAQLLISKPDIYLKNNFLMTDFKTQILLEKKEIDTIQSGLTTTIRLRIELWEKGRLISRLKITKDWTREISFDIWKRIYTLVISENRVPVQFENYHQLSQSLIKKEMLPILPLQSIDSHQRYFVRIRVTVESINQKEMKEIKRWVDDSNDLINVGNILAFLIKQKTKNDHLYVHSDNFIPANLPIKE